MKSLFLCLSLAVWPALSGTVTVPTVPAAPIALYVDFQQTPAVIGFLARHFGKDLGASWILLSQPFRDINVDTAVFFFVGDGEGQDLAFCQV